MCRFEHDLHNQGVVSTSLHVDPLVVTSHAQVEAHKTAGEGSGWEARGDWEAAWGGCWRGNRQGMGKDTCMLRENRAEGADSGEGRGAGSDTHSEDGDDDEEAGSTSQGEGEKRGGEGAGQQGEVWGYAREPTGVGATEGARVRQVERFRRRRSERQELGPGSTCGRRAQRWVSHEEVGEWWDLEGAGEQRGDGAAEEAPTAAAAAGEGRGKDKGKRGKRSRTRNRRVEQQGHPRGNKRRKRLEGAGAESKGGKGGRGRGAGGAGGRDEPAGGGGKES
jgi:hypothetical protein